MQIGITQVKPGLSIKLDDGNIYIVVEYAHVKPGKGGAFVRTKLKNVRLGTLISRTFRSNEKIEEAYIEKKNLQYLYSSHDAYEFMDYDTYDQISLQKEVLGNIVNYLRENMEVIAYVYDGEILNIELPISVELKIASTEPGIKGDTSRSGTKPAATETGLIINVPLFINEGDRVRVDTRTDEYIERA